MFTKIWTWIKMNLASVLGTIQVVIKGVKEVITAILNAISIIMPASAAERIILKVRAVIEQVDGWFEKIKAWLLAAVVTLP